MGVYINLEGSNSTGRKLGWCVANGNLITKPTEEDFDKLPKESMFVAVVDNVAYIALWVAYDKEEFLEMIDPREDREMTWFKIPVEKIKLVSNLNDYLPGGAVYEE